MEREKLTVIGNALPQYAIKMLDCQKLRARYKTVLPVIETVVEKGDKPWRDKRWKVIPREALRVTEERFLKRTENILRPPGWQGFLFID